jgi:predicted P-loop ATPase
LIDYMGAEDTALHRTFGRLLLVAAVRRVRQPGCKFDQIGVLEGPEGTGKSKALETIAGRENFSDQTILSQSDKEQQELLRGVWIYEIAELAGMRRSEVEKQKAFASRTHDRARPAYGRRRDISDRGKVYWKRSV